jgi:hypothetical protein
MPGNIVLASYWYLCVLIRSTDSRSWLTVVNEEFKASKQHLALSALWMSLLFFAADICWSHVFPHLYTISKRILFLSLQPTAIECSLTSALSHSTLFIYIRFFQCYINFGRFAAIQFISVHQVHRFVLGSAYPTSVRAALLSGIRDLQHFLCLVWQNIVRLLT